MLVEAFVFRCHRSLDQRGGKLLIAHEGAVLYMISGKDFPFFRYYLGGKLGIRVLQFLYGRDVCECPDNGQEGEHRHYGSHHQYPEPENNPFLSFVCHVKIFLVRHKTLGLAKNPVYKSNQKIWKIAPILLYFAKIIEAARPKKVKDYGGKTTGHSGVSGESQDHSEVFGWRFSCKGIGRAYP